MTAARDGTPWIRTSIYRYDVHQGPGQFTWGSYDKHIDDLVQAHAKLLVILCCSTSWDTTAPNDPSIRAVIKTKFMPANDLKYWREYVRAVATRYKGRIAAYEIWNEPGPGPAAAADEELASRRGTPADFAAVVSAASDEIRAADPNALIVGSGFQRGAFQEHGWFEQFWHDPTNEKEALPP